MITLDNCEQWFTQQPEKLTFIEVNWQDDMCVLCELEKSKTTREQWKKKPLINLQNVKFTEWNLKTTVVNCIAGFISRKANRCMMLLL